MTLGKRSTCRFITTSITWTDRPSSRPLTTACPWPSRQRAASRIQLRPSSQHWDTSTFGPTRSLVCPRIIKSNNLFIKRNKRKIYSNSNGSKLGLFYRHFVFSGSNCLCVYMQIRKHLCCVFFVCENVWLEWLVGTGRKRAFITCCNTFAAYSADRFLLMSTRSRHLATVFSPFSCPLVAFSLFHIFSPLLEIDVNQDWTDHVI